MFKLLKRDGHPEKRDLCFVMQPDSRPDPTAVRQGSTRFSHLVHQVFEHAWHPSVGLIEFRGLGDLDERFIWGLQELPRFVMPSSEIQARCIGTALGKRSHSDLVGTR